MMFSVSDWIRYFWPQTDAVSPSVTKSTQVGKVWPLPPIKILEAQVEKLKAKAARKRSKPVTRRSDGQARKRLDKG